MKSEPARPARGARARGDLVTMGSTARDLARSPLGVIALFIVLIYSIATMFMGLAAANFPDSLRAPLVWFVVLFPVMVLAVFTWLVICYPINLYGPSDLGPELFVKLQEQLQTTQRRLNVLSEVTPGVAMQSLPVAADAIAPKPASRGVTPAPIDTDDPQRGRWGGQREAGHRRITVGSIRPLDSDPENYRILLEVCSTDPERHPLGGKVTFHLHDTFSPDVEEVSVRNGAARLTLVAYGAFTVGAETDDGVRLELNLADADVDAPREFKAA